MRRNRKWVLGRRRYSWEWKHNQNRPEQPPSIIGGLLVVLVATYSFIRPVFWLLVAVLAFIAACFAVIGLGAAWEWFSRTSGRPRPMLGQKNALPEKAIGQTPNSWVADSASLKPKEAPMTHNTKFALIDTYGDERFAAIIDGTFQIGKERRATPTRIEDFAKAILIDGEDGRFVCSDGRKPAVLKFRGKAREAVAYRLDPQIATSLGIPAFGTR
jgi:hypothetical protein